MRMRNLWAKVGVPGSVSMAFGSLSFESCSATEPELKSMSDVMDAQWVPNLLEPPAHTQINYMVTDLEGGPRPSSTVEYSYRANILTRGMYPAQLTTVGMQQLYELGERLRKRSIQDTDFINPQRSMSTVFTSHQRHSPALAEL
uniref:Uncharacterized protein n=1 Tax=Oncorhynchus tshawytscha TaxID=74940 RepID=A0A8C8FQX2_ONCTS